MNARGAAIDLSDVTRLPVRLTTAEVCAIARFSPVTLRRRQKAGRFPTAIPGEQGIYARDAVLEALGLGPQVGNISDDSFQRAADAFHRNRLARKRRAA